ncbi:GIY-YIG nuclease family protein [Homoserinibacter gongjuensis]|uniref:GIY-YIG domain-containing protein n=1 Tax=Homoserinibacter gongjuensis TaxID=1162968 RepID=A0ABQ6JVA0_9MICO|nr:hypothetical protein [Homoserinibacter gongjuensis]GMA90670.1 hypothetical protein GCM10025869_11990 [Homoserinibacter gongjuensis]
MPVELVYVQEFGSVAEAFAAEKQVQGWSRAKREALIRGQQHRLPELSRKKRGVQNSGFRYAAAPLLNARGVRVCRSTCGGGPVHRYSGAGT